MQIVQKAVRGNAVTATTASNSEKLGGKDANSYKLNGDFAVLTGTVKLNANTSENATENVCTYTNLELNYPTGFNKDNCVVISCGRQNTSNYGYAYGWNNKIDSTSSMSGILPIRISLFGASTLQWANKIRVQFGNLTTESHTITYKIILMKIS